MGRRKNNIPPKRKMTAEDLGQRILRVFDEDPSRPMNYKQLAARMGYNTREARGPLEQSLKLLERDGQIIAVDKGRYKIKYHENYATGRVDMTSTGNAYVVSDVVEHDIYVKAGNIHHALHGDEVKVLLFARRKKNVQICRNPSK